MKIQLKKLIKTKMDILNKFIMLIKHLFILLAILLLGIHFSNNLHINFKNFYCFNFGLILKLIVLIQY